MKRLLSSIACGCALFFTSVRDTEAQQQRDPVPVLASMIYQFQDGTPLQNWYSPQLWEMFRMQTQGTGIYWPLRNLGPVNNIVVNSRLDLPVGALYSMTAFHAGGRSDWRIGINSYTDRIEYADTALGQAGPYTLPSAQPTTPDPGPASPTNPDPTPPITPDPPSATSEACKQFPDLC